MILLLQAKKSNKKWQLIFGLHHYDYSVLDYSFGNHGQFQEGCISTVLCSWDLNFIQIPRSFN